MSADDVLAEYLRNSLSNPIQGKAADIAARTGLQVLAPWRDKMTLQIWPTVQKFLPELKGDVLDVGCYGGWLYPYVRGQAEYHGIDVWDDAIEAATCLFGPYFEVKSVFNYSKQHEVVWCTQITTLDVNETWKKLCSLAKRLVVYASPSIKWSLPGSTEEYDGDVNRVVIRRL